MSAERFFYCADGVNVMGPFDAAAIALMIRNGQLGLQTLVCLEGTERWIAAGQCPQICPARKKPKKQPAPSIWRNFLTSAFVLFFLVVWLCFIIGRSESRTTPREDGPTPNQNVGPQLDAVSWHWGQDGDTDYVLAEGEVKNLTNEPMKNVEAIVTFRTASGEFISSETAFTQFNPIMPGQTSPWKVICPYNPEMQKAGLEFKDFMGQTFDTKTHPQH